jgi:hypothetical protein
MLIDSMFDVLNIEQCSFGYEEKTQIYPKEKMMNGKPIVEHLVLARSLLNLRDEIAETYGTNGSTVNSILYKINSCLFSEYPHRYDNNED